MVDLNKSRQFTFAPTSTSNSTTGFFAKPTNSNSSFTFGQTSTGGTGTASTTSGFGGLTSGLFGTNSQPNTGTTTTGFGGGGMFPTTNPSSTTTSSGFFGIIYIYLVNKPTTTTGGGTNTLFGSSGLTNPTTSGAGTSNLFSTVPSTGGSNPLLQPSNSNFIPHISINPQVNNPYQNVFQISSTNMMKYDKVETLPQEVKSYVINIEKDINNNDILLDQTKKTIDDLYNEFGLIKREGQKMLNCLKLIYTKHQKICYIIEALKNDVKVQNDYLEINIKNYNILHNYPEMKINVPSQYFTKLALEFTEKMSNFKKELDELETIIELTYQVNFP
jgi:hypothetical protein